MLQRKRFETRVRASHMDASTHKKTNEGCAHYLLEKPPATTRANIWSAHVFSFRARARESCNDVEVLGMVIALCYLKGKDIAGILVVWLYDIHTAFRTTTQQKKTTPHPLRELLDKIAVAV